MFDSKKQLSPAEARAEVDRLFDLERTLTEQRRKTASVTFKAARHSRFWLARELKSPRRKSSWHKKRSAPLRQRS